MAENSRPAAEPLQKGAQAAQMVRGAVKTGKAIAGAAKGAAAGGPYGAAAGFVWENRKVIGKIIIAVIAFMMIPIMLLCIAEESAKCKMFEEFAISIPQQGWRARQISRYRIHSCR